MEQLWTPWRYDYVTSGNKSTDCPFCRAAGGNDPDTERLVVHRTPQSVVVMNLYPYNAGHVMIAPRRHVASLSLATPEEVAETMTLARRLEEAMREVYKPDGLNVGMNLGRPAGAGVADHIHLHVVPRWSGDTNFMTVFGDTRVIPEEPARGCERLRPFFAR
jgi:ATP adenylyltransferase